MLDVYLNWRGNCDLDPKTTLLIKQQKVLKIIFMVQVTSLFDEPPFHLPE